MALTILGNTRRFARILVGNAIDADTIVRQMINRDTIPKLGLDTHPTVMHLLCHEVARLVPDDVEYRFGGPAGATRLMERAQEDLDALSTFQRKVFALSEVEQYDAADVAMILQADINKVLATIEDVREIMFSQNRTAFVVVEDPNYARLIQSRLVHANIDAAVYTNYGEALLALDEAEYDLLVIEPRTGDDITNEFYDYAESATGPVIWLTPSTPLAEDHPPRLGQKLMGAIAIDELLNEMQGGLYIEPHLWSPPDELFKMPDGFDDEALAPTVAPIDAEVVDGQLRPAPGPQPDSAVSTAALDALRKKLLEDARFQTEEARSSNTAPRVKRHLEAMVPLLDQPLTEGMVIGLAVGVDGLARLLPIIEEEFTRLAATDIAGFIVDLQRFTNQFPVFRQFNAEASATRPIKPDEEEALQSVVSVLIAQPDAVVSAELKQQFETLQAARAKQAGSAVSDVGWVRSVANLLKAVARDVKSFTHEAGKDARGKFAKGMGTLIVALPVATGLHLLGGQWPTEFAAVALLLTRSREQIDATFGKGDDADK